MGNAKFWLASKTMIFGLATAVAPTVLYYLSGVDWTAFGLSPAAGGAIGTAIMALRYMTTQPVTASTR